ncbi:MAG: 30S ribosomal protein S6 [Desulfobacteraceae bacterium 4572_187]|nr:MAG: 30S ribosomal protein S6 [Desulfobacteraceae bacterium 4572_187]
MKRYETIVIIDPDLAEEERAGVLERTTDLIPKEGGFLVMLDEWGTRKLAYEIKKKVRGYYVRIDYCGMGPLVDEMERFFRIDDKVLKFMTVLLEKNADIENIKEEMAIAKSEAEAEKARKKAEDAEKKAEDARKKAEEAEKEANATEKKADATDEVHENDNESDTDNIPLDSSETETVETEEAKTETTETKINKEEQ